MQNRSLSLWTQSAKKAPSANPFTRRTANWNIFIDQILLWYNFCFNFLFAVQFALMAANRRLKTVFILFQQTVWLKFKVFCFCGAGPAFARFFPLISNRPHQLRQRERESESVWFCELIKFNLPTTLGPGNQFYGFNWVRWSERAIVVPDLLE